MSFCISYLQKHEFAQHSEIAEKEITFDEKNSNFSTSIESKKYKWFAIVKFCKARVCFIK